MKAFTENRTKTYERVSTQKEVYGNLLLIFNKDYNKENLAEWIRIHKEMISKRKPGIIKTTKKRKVTVFQLNQEEEIIVKEFRKFNLLIRKTPLFCSKPIKAWLNANLYFSLLNGPSVPIALVIEKKFGVFSLRSYVIYRSASGFIKLNQYVQSLSSLRKEEQREFLKSLAAFLHTLRQLGLQHKDLKAGNLLVKEHENRWSFLLVDYEDLEVRPWDLRFVVKFLQQMWNSLKALSLDSSLTYSFLKFLMKPFMAKERKRLIKALKDRKNINADNKGMLR